MGKRRLPVRMAGQTLKALFTKSAAMHNPNDDLLLPPGCGGKLAHDAVNCTWCQACVRNCLMQTLEGEFATMPDVKPFTLSLNLTKCICCGQCVAACPHGCLQLIAEAERGCLNKRELEQIKL